MGITEKLRKKLEQRKHQLESKGKGFGYENLKEGKTTWLFLNPGDDADFCIDVEMFFFSKEIGGYISPTVVGKPDYGMEMYLDLKKSKDEDDNELAAKFKPRKAHLAAIALFKDEKNKEFDLEKSPTLGKITGKTYAELIDWMLDEDYGDFTDEKDGYPVKITRTGSGQYDTNYMLKKLDRKFGKLPKELKGAHDLEAMIAKIVPTYEQTKEMTNKFLGISDDDDDEPKKKKKKGSKDKKSKKSSKEEEPVKKKKKKKKTSDI